MFHNNRMIKALFMLDVENNDDPNTMLQNREFYEIPMNYTWAKDLRAALVLAKRTSYRVGGGERLEFYTELFGSEGTLNRVDDPKDLTDSKTLLFFKKRERVPEEPTTN